MHGGAEGATCGCRELQAYCRGEKEVRWISSTSQQGRMAVDIAEVARATQDEGFIKVVRRLVLG